MELKDLGYTEKWLKYGLLTEEILTNQLKEFDNEEDQYPEHYRFRTFQNWLKQKDSITDLEVENFIELTIEDPDEAMAGSVLRELFTRPQITDYQFELIKSALSKFGNWATKLIQREELKKKISNEGLKNDVLKKCIDYTKEYNENVLLQVIIDKANSPEIIEEIISTDLSKKIRNLALEKLRKLKKAGNN